MSGVDWDALNEAEQAVFGEPIEYRPAGSQVPFTARGAFERFQVNVQPEEGAAVSVPRSLLTVKLSDFPTGFVYLEGDRVLVRGLSFDVVAFNADNLGAATLELGLIG